jgi:hypothetical protein
MKIIFLDLDGVLKKIPSAKERKSRAEKSWFDFIYELDKDLVDNFKYLLEKTWAKIVISSSWRHNMDRVYKSFTEAGIDINLIIWKTKSNLDYWRWNEVLTRIFDYIKSDMIKWDIKDFVMIDDDDFDTKCVKRLWKFVHTKATQWLTMEKVNETILILN